MQVVGLSSQMRYAEVGLAIYSLVYGVDEGVVHYFCRKVFRVFLKVFAALVLATPAQSCFAWLMAKT